MSLAEVLESVIVDNNAVMRLHHDYFLPVNLLLAEDKLLKILNFVGLYLQTQKHVHWLIPVSLSLTSLVMGFTTTGRLSVDGFICGFFCWPFYRAVQLLCDQLPLSMRRRVYCWGDWVEHLKPSNDLQSKVVMGGMCALVAAGAKAHSESFLECDSLDDPQILPNPVKISALVGGEDKANARLQPLLDFESNDKYEI
ncbi:hypothetical protein SUGI_0096560 [Cryptomeria japonica]|nr:hypothetical protein SUGI_0096560 [Cryptomeria japonica]